MSDIRKLEELLSPHIDAGSEFVNYTAKKLTLPGENYGSLMLALEVKLKAPDNAEKLLNIVAKLILENAWLRKMFKVEYTFPKELNFYDKIVPAMVHFQLEQGVEDVIDIFPKYFGGRLNLKPDSDEVDEDGIILLENLKLSGYVTVDRRKGFDKETTELILKNLAVFHAVPIALKLKKPKVFEEEVLPHIKFVRLFDNISKEMEESTIKKFENYVKSDPNGAHLVTRVRSGLVKCLENWGVLKGGPFTTITHNDYWINNTMLKFDENGKPVENKIIDFQVVDYGSPGKDLVFLLFVSVQTPLVEQYFDHFLKVYHDKFIETLTSLHCDVTPFTFEALKEEIDFAGRNNEFFHCLVMVRPVLVSPNAVKELNDMSEQDFLLEDIPQEEIGKANFIIKGFAKRNWI